MHVEMENITLAWSWRWGVLLVVGTTVALYLRGWFRLRHHSAFLPVGNGRLLLFLLSLCGLLLTLISPLHLLATALFTAHVVQHLLLVALLPCLLLLTDPFPVVAAGLPLSWRRQLRRQWRQLTRLRPALIWLFSPGPVFFLFVTALWIWYDPTLHQATLRLRWLHNLETGVVALAALLYWRHILNAAPRDKRPLPLLGRVIYAVVGTWPLKLVGIVLLFSDQSIYHYPADIQLTGLLINDQSIGAIIAWVLGGVVFSSTAIILMRHWMQEEDQKPSLTYPAWHSEEAMIAPGFRRGARD